MDVVGVSIICRADANHCLELRWLTRGNLQPVETTPRFANHADLAIAPGLRSEPLQNFERIVLLLWQILVQHQAIRVATPTQVDTNRRISMRSEIGMDLCVSLHRRIVLSIRDVFQDRRHRTDRIGLWHPNPRGQPHTIRHRNPNVRDLLNV